MPTKKEWLDYVKARKQWSKLYDKETLAIQKWAKSLKPGEITTAEAGPGSNPPTPPPKPPGGNS